jgi:hypothetical protein
MAGESKRGDLMLLVSVLTRVQWLILDVQDCNFRTQVEGV